MLSNTCGSLVIFIQRDWNCLFVSNLPIRKQKKWSKEYLLEIDALRHQWDCFLKVLLHRYRYQVNYVIRDLLYSCSSLSTHSSLGELILYSNLSHTSYSQVSEIVSWLFILFIPETAQLHVLSILLGMGVRIKVWMRGIPYRLMMTWRGFIWHHIWTVSLKEFQLSWHLFPAGMEVNYMLIVFSSQKCWKIS